MAARPRQRQPLTEPARHIRTTQELASYLPLLSVIARVTVVLPAFPLPLRQTRVTRGAHFCLVAFLQRSRHQVIRLFVLRRTARTRGSLAGQEFPQRLDIPAVLGSVLGAKPEH